MVHYRTTITSVGPDVQELLESGMLILFADGAPPELAEVSVQHRVIDGPSDSAPHIGAEIRIGAVSARLTAIGDLAWKKVADIGHVVVNFNGAATAQRPGELSASEIDAAALAAALRPGAEIIIAA